MDARLRLAERHPDPAAWRALFAELRRVGRVAEARAAALAAWDRAHAEVDRLLAFVQARPRRGTATERAGVLAQVDVLLAECDEANDLARELLPELHREADGRRCFCDRHPLPHDLHLGRLAS